MSSRSKAASSDSFTSDAKSVPASASTWSVIIHAVRNGSLASWSTVDRGAFGPSRASTYSRTSFSLSALSRSSVSTGDSSVSSGAPPATRWACRVETITTAWVASLVSSEVAIENDSPRASSSPSTTSTGGVVSVLTTPTSSAAPRRGPSGSGISPAPTSWRLSRSATRSASIARACTAASTEFWPGSACRNDGPAVSSRSRSAELDRLTTRPSTADLPVPGDPVTTRRPGIPHFTQLTTLSTCVVRPANHDRPSVESPPRAASRRCFTTVFAAYSGLGSIGCADPYCMKRGRWTSLSHAFSNAVPTAPPSTSAVRSLHRRASSSAVGPARSNLRS